MSRAGSRPLLGALSICVALDAQTPGTPKSTITDLGPLGGNSSFGVVDLGTLGGLLSFGYAVNRAAAVGLDGGCRTLSAAGQRTC